MAVRWRARVEHPLFRSNCLHREKKTTQRKMANLTTSRQFNGRIISRWSCALCAMLRSGTLCSVLSGSVKAVLAHEEKDGMLSCLTGELQTTPISGWLVFLPLFLRRSHLLFPCSVHQSPHLFIVLPWLCLWPQSMSCEHQLWRSSLERPHFLNTGNSLEVLTLWSPRKLEFSEALFKNHRLQVELEFKCFWSDPKSELYLKLSDKWGIVDKVTLKSRQSTAVRKKNRPR